jgi:hypothetical protein
MKSAFPYVIGSLLLLGGVVSCTKKDSTPQSDFFLQATKDSTPWTASASGTYSKARKELYVLGQAGDAAKAEVLSLGCVLPAWPQRTPVQVLPAAWRVLLGYDGLTDSYATAEAASSPRVEITRLDTVNKVVEGRFEATLLRDKQWTSKAETLDLKSGSFRVQYTTVP